MLRYLHGKPRVAINKDRLNQLLSNNIPHVAIGKELGICKAILYKESGAHKSIN